MLSKSHIAAIALLSAAVVTATEPARAADRRPDPADPAILVPAPDYQSVFAGYRKPGADERLDWRQANDVVRDVGGHAGALKQAPDMQRQGAMPAHSMPAQSMRKPAAMPHGHPMGHGRHQ
jgi:hypothetical protein